MTHLYRLDCSAHQMASRFGARAGDDPWAGGYIAPIKFAPVVTAGRDFIAGPRPSGRALQPRITPRLWGVSPPPKADDPTRRITHVRNPDSPFWIGNLRNSEFRCLIPATSFMLWGSEIDYEGRRLKQWFAPQTTLENRVGTGGTAPPIFALAGVWKDEEVPGFAILTHEAKGAAKDAGCRSMPLILPDDEDAHQTWLHGGWDQARRLVERPTTIALEQWTGEVN
ncbi:SOS response-associated peptidase family protein [Erythrobacter sp. Alg231-14]|uniref:SOS response-associated peptidase family protein n=1 Tax=Erythrobacter sp. Alg231-14 TaxID=1922225 RepID=UPI000D550F4B